MRIGPLMGRGAQLRGECRKGARAMAHGIFIRRGKLGRRTLLPKGYKYRIVAKATRAARRARDVTFP